MEEEKIDYEININNINSFIFIVLKLNTSYLSNCNQGTYFYTLAEVALLR